MHLKIISVLATVASSSQSNTGYTNVLLNSSLFLLFSEDTHETPLHMCVQRHDCKFTKLLIKANADLYIRDHIGDRPIDIKQENEEVTNTLKAAMFEKDRVEKAKTSSS